MRITTLEVSSNASDLGPRLRGDDGFEANARFDRLRGDDGFEANARFEVDGNTMGWQLTRPLSSAPADPAWSACP